MATIISREYQSRDRPWSGPWTGLYVQVFDNISDEALESIIPISILSPTALAKLW